MSFSFAQTAKEMKEVIPRSSRFCHFQESESSASTLSITEDVKDTSTICNPKIVPIVLDSKIKIDEIKKISRSIRDKYGVPSSSQEIPLNYWLQEKFWLKKEIDLVFIDKDGDIIGTLEAKKIFEEYTVNEYEPDSLFITNELILDRRESKKLMRRLKKGTNKKAKKFIEESIDFYQTMKKKEELYRQGNL